MRWLSARTSSSPQLFERVKGALAPDIDVHDASVVFEMVAAIKLGDRARTQELRRRYLAIILDGMRAQRDESLPASAPTWRELNERWVTGTEASTALHSGT